MQMLRIRQDLESWRNQKSSPNMQKNEQVDKEVQWLYLVEKSPPPTPLHIVADPAGTSPILLALDAPVCLGWCPTALNYMS